MGKLRTSARQVKIAARRAVVVDLRVQGGTLRNIAEMLRNLPPEERARLGVSDKYCDVDVHRDLMAEIKRLNTEAAEGVEEVKRLELERLDALQAAWWEQATERLDPAAFDRIMTIMQRRARYLGLDVPVRAEVSGPGGGPVPVKAYVTVSPDDWDSANSAVQAVAVADSTVAG